FGSRSRRTKPPSSSRSSTPVIDAVVSPVARASSPAVIGPVSATILRQFRSVALIPIRSAETCPRSCMIDPLRLMASNNSPPRPAATPPRPSPPHPPPPAPPSGPALTHPHPTPPPSAITWLTLNSSATPRTFPERTEPRNSPRLHALNSRFHDVVRLGRRCF